MPDPRPMASLRFGQYDEPPASESSTPRTRRVRLHRALRATADMAASDLAEMGASPQPSPPRRQPYASLQRRRQRSPSSDPRDAGGSEGSWRRRPKRRKLDSDVSGAPVQPIKYGHYGQVEAGRLKLDIISCDGGEHRDPRHPSTYLGPQNLLRHDKSVYCSERSSSGIVLRHADDTPFCLEKLHIVGPEHGFTAPVREGLVYVAMSLNDLQQYMDPPPHARLRGIDSPPYRRQRSFRSSPEQITLSDALRDPEISAALDANQRDHASWAHDLSDREDAYGAPRFREDQHCDVPPSEDILDSGATVEASYPPIALLSDEEPGPEENSSQEVLDFRLQRLRNMRRFDRDVWNRDDRTNWSRTNEPYDSNERDRDGSWNLRHLDAMMARSRMADSPQREDHNDDREDNQRPDRRYPASASYYHQAEVLPEGLEHHADDFNDPKVTRARFHIRRGKYKVAIKFDPPISGRFILLKLWANRGNVDVQTVIAKGYGGARFFPAVEFR